MSASRYGWITFDSLTAAVIALSACWSPARAAASRCRSLVICGLFEGTPHLIKDRRWSTWLRAASSDCTRVRPPLNEGDSLAIWVVSAAGSVELVGELMIWAK